jgi:hypothetical protein
MGCGSSNASNLLRKVKPVDINCLRKYNLVSKHTPYPKVIAPHPIRKASSPFLNHPCPAESCSQKIARIKIFQDIKNANTRNSSAKKSRGTPREASRTPINGGDEYFADFQKIGQKCFSKISLIFKGPRNSGLSTDSIDL